MLREQALVEDSQENNPGSSSKPKNGRTMTEAERKFQEVRLKRMRERVAKEAKKSHKEKVDDFNKYLEAQTDHFDLPRIGPG
ncbi:Conserved alpha-helical protein [Ceraceosorus bombacis]|uniref:Conserved alpha-helical protein n=1 Tax=Ceraceosorus bombacis TaxID=401625 RepID=A0A0N7LA39_9BASI|nr:Conserved alpha-helical protein [Ceraceosorus bombacis]